MEVLLSPYMLKKYGKHHIADEIFTEKERERIMASMFGELPTAHDSPQMRIKKNLYRVNLYGIHTKCKACNFDCKVLQFRGEFICFEFRRKK